MPTIQIAISSDMCITLTWNLTGSCGQQQTSWVVSYGGKTIPRWRTAAILKIDISPYLCEKSSDFHEILYTAADFELDERHPIKHEKLHWTDTQVRQNVFLVHATLVILLNLTQRNWLKYSDQKCVTKLCIVSIYRLDYCNYLRMH